MNTRSIAAAAIAAFMTFALTAPATVLAGDRHHGSRGGGHHSSHKDGRHYKHHRKHQRKHHYKRHNRGHGGHTTNYYRNDNDHEDLLIGLVVGGILGYAINSTQHQDDISYDRYPDTRRAYPATDTYRYDTNTCLQEREYQTTVIVGGREVDAYGTACLQPDGSWKRAPAQLVSY